MYGCMLVFYVYQLICPSSVMDQRVSARGYGRVVSMLFIPSDLIYGIKAFVLVQA